MIFSENVVYYPLGDRAIVVAFGDTLTEQGNLLVHSLDAAISRTPWIGVTECVPAYNTLTVYYDPVYLAYDNIFKLLQRAVDEMPLKASQSNRETIVPVFYNGPDLLEVAQYTGLPVDEIITLHTASVYRVYMLGFVPGFPYLGGMDKRLAMPRKTTPRLKIAAGSVGIAGEQTGIYPLETPGGWQIIGHTPLKLFDSRQEDQPTLLAAGDLLRFVAINEDEFLAIKALYDGN